MIAQGLKLNEEMVLYKFISGKWDVKDEKKRLQREDFESPSHQELFDTIMRVIKKDGVVTTDSVIQELKERESLDAFGGEAAVRELTLVAESIDLEKELRSLKRKSLFRKIREYTNETDQVEAFKKITSALEKFSFWCNESHADLDKQLELEKEEKVKTFLENHRLAFSNGALISGFAEIDKRLFYIPGDLVIVQGMSNHGKTKWMEEKAYKFLTNDRNAEKQPICVFISFENSPLLVKQDFLNLISKHEKEGDRFIAYDPRYFEKKEVVSPFLYPDIEKEFRSTISIYETLKKNQSLIFLENQRFEDLNQLLHKLKQQHKDRPIAVFLDYIQIISNDLNSDGWERIKEISYGLERLAQSNKVIVIAGSQVNDKRETREGKDVYNAATIVEDVFNHSHSSLELNESLKAQFIPQVDGKNIVSINITKYKRGSTFSLNKTFLFDGYSFSCDSIYQNSHVRSSKNTKEKYSNSDPEESYDLGRFK